MKYKRLPLLVLGPLDQVLDPLVQDLDAIVVGALDCHLLSGLPSYVNTDTTVMTVWPISILSRFFSN
jgi:hypothetical protein